MAMVSNFLNRSAVIIVTLLVFSIYGGIVRFSFAKPYMWDELVFVRAGSAIAQHGDAIYIHEKATALRPWYPTWYWEVLKYSIYLGGENALRLTGSFFFLLNVLLVCMLTHAVTKRSLPVILSGILTISSPFLVRGSLLIEIDTSILCFALLLFNWCVAVSYERRKTVWNVILCGGVLSLAHYAKYFTSFFVILASFVYMPLSSGRKQGIRDAMLLNIIAICVFVGLWLVNCALAHYDPLFPIEFMKTRTHGMSFFSVTLLKEMIVGMIRKTLWLSPYVIGLLMLSLFVHLRDGFLGIRRPLVTFIWLQVLMSGAAYVLIGLDAAGYPKYLYPIYFVAIPLLADAISQSLETLHRRAMVGSIVLAAVATIYFYGTVKDPVYAMIVYKFTRFGAMGIPVVSVRDVIFQLGMWLLPLMGVAVILLKYRTQGWRIAHVTVFALAVASGTSMLIRQSNGGYSHLYMYGMPDRSVFETADFLRDHIDVHSSRTMVLPAEIAYYADSAQRYYDVDIAFQDGSFSQIIERERPSAIVLREHNFGTSQSATLLNSTAYSLLMNRGGYQRVAIPGYIIYYTVS